MVQFVPLCDIVTLSIRFIGFGFSAVAQMLLLPASVLMLCCWLLVLLIFRE
jgi:hypothetical protein